MDGCSRRPRGPMLATDVDIQYLNDIRLPNLEVRRLNILEDPLEQNAYDVVTARAVLHHLPDNVLAVERMVSALKPGGVFLSIEPDMLPATAAEPESMRKFWQGWLKWSVSVGIDYSIGRKMPALLVSRGLEDIGAQGYAEFFNGGSLWANMWLETIEELQPRLLDSGSISQELLDDFYKDTTIPLTGPPTSTLSRPGDGSRKAMAESLEDALISIWKQALVENKKTVELAGQSFTVRETARRQLCQVDFTFDGKPIRGLEQNPETKSRWAQMARSGKK